MIFKDRAEAGKILAGKLLKYKDKKAVVYALPRGGVVTGAEIAKALNAPLDLIITRKIGHPFQPEYAIGAVAENGHLAKNDVISSVDQSWLKREIANQRKEAQRRRKLYLTGRKPLPVKGKTAILVDDGIATGLTMRAAIGELKHKSPKKIVVAVPVAPKDVALKIESEVDEFTALKTPLDYLGTVGAYYEDFPQVENEEVIKILRSQKKQDNSLKGASIFKKVVHINVDSVILEGILELPKDSRGLVLFAHGSGSSRFSPRNTFVANILQQEKIGTLLFDLLTAKEDEIYENRFNIELLTQRLLLTTKWAKNQPDLRALNLGYFGASTGATAALRAASRLGTKLKAVVSRGGRPDLAEIDLTKVTSPTLFIVGKNDTDVLELNKVAMDKLHAVKKLAVIPGATHLFEEPGALEKVAKLAAEWFKKYLL